MCFEGSRKAEWKGEKKHAARTRVVRSDQSVANATVEESFHHLDTPTPPKRIKRSSMITLVKHKGKNKKEYN